jgi:hypothetical protein
MWRVRRDEGGGWSELFESEERHLANELERLIRRYVGRCAIRVVISQR